jgi:hypothetical protein
MYHYNEEKSSTKINVNKGGSDSVYSFFDVSGFKASFRRK